MSWRDTWHPDDPDRVCYTCGTPSSHRYQDGSPAYACKERPGNVPHVPVRATPDEEARWKAQPYPWVSDATEDEMTQAWALASRIDKAGRAMGAKTKFLPRGREQLEMDHRGVLAELVAARLTGLPRHEVYLQRGYRSKDKPPDIGRNVEVRNTRDRGGALAVYKEDPPERICLLVVGLGPFLLRGWALADEARRRGTYDPIEHERTVPRWLLPQERLHRMPLPEDA